MKTDFSPITIVENNVTITLEEYTINKQYDNCKGCILNEDSLCSEIKGLSLNPKRHQSLCAVEIVVHIINASDEKFDPSRWTMIDSEGYSFESERLCGILLPRRFHSGQDVLPATQSKQIFVFTELEKGMIPSSFVLHDQQHHKDWVFRVNALSSAVQSILTPPKPTDSLQDKQKAYIHTESCRLLMDALEKKQPLLSDNSREIVIRNLADNYYISINNDEDVWETKKCLLKEHPYLISIAEIVDTEYAEKNIFLVHSSSTDAFETILQRLNLNYEKTTICIDDIPIDVFVIVQTFSSIEEYKSLKTETNGKLVWRQAEQERIPCGYYVLDKTIRYSIFTEAQIRIRGYRELDLAKARFAKAGYRNDLGEAFRSSWEANVARFLRNKSIKYTYEKQPYIMEKNAYLPDFELENNVILEVKGVWDAESLRKTVEFHRLYPEKTLLPIDEDTYYDINAEYSHLPFWEKTSISQKTSYIPVVGLSFVPDKSVFNAISENMTVNLVREHENSYDKNAILVTHKDGRTLGHIAADWAMVYAPKLDAGIRYEARITQIKTKVIIIGIKRSNTDERVFFQVFR